MDHKPWLKCYDEGVPYSLEPYPEITLLDVVHDAALDRPRHPALFFKGAQISYGQLDRLSDAFGAALVKMGVQKGDRVALMMPNCPQAVIAQLGAWKAGAIVAPLNPMYTLRELEHAFLECQAETAVVLTLFYEKVKAIQAKTPLRRVIATNIKEYLPAHLRPFFTLFKEKKGGHHIRLQPGDTWMGELLRQHARSPRPDVTVGPKDPALLLFTGGTTGEPKVAVGSHQALVISGMQIMAWYSAGSVLSWTETILGTFPLYHVTGNVANMASVFIGRNTYALVPDPRDLDDLLDTIQRSQATLFPGVPTLFTAVSNHPKVQSKQVDFSTIKLSTSGGAPLMLETKKRFEDMTGGRVTEGYALTESMMAGVFTPLYGKYKAGAVGLPLPDVEVRIVDADTGQARLGPNEPGEIIIRAPQLMLGYWRRPIETANAIHDGWLFTGDLGYMDEDGYLFIVDRKKEVIKPGGFQVWPREVEEVIASHPAVLEACVAGIPDAYQGEAVKAWVVLRPGMSASPEELRDYCKQSLAAYKVPKRIEFRSTLPKSAVGKILKRELRLEDQSKR